MEIMPTTEKLTYEEFRVKRLAYKQQQEEKYPWEKGLESDFEDMTKHLYDRYYIGKNKEFVWTRGYKIHDYNPY